MSEKSQSEQGTVTEVAGMFSAKWMSTARQCMSISKEGTTNEGEKWKTCHQKARKKVIVAKLSLKVWSI
jgi:hypothetical protein